MLRALTLTLIAQIQNLGSPDQIENTRVFIHRLRQYNTTDQKDQSLFQATMAMRLAPSTVLE